MTNRTERLSCCNVAGIEKERFRAIRRAQEPFFYIITGTNVRNILFLVKVREVKIENCTVR